MLAFTAFRIAVVAVVVALAESRGVPLTSTAAGVTTGYLALVTGLALVSGAPSPWPSRLRVTTVTTAAALVADALYLHHEYVRLGSQVPVDMVGVAFLVTACLLVSVPAGLLLAAGLTVLRVVDGGAVDPVDVLATWLVVLATAAAAGVHGRGLTRGRRDAEALERLSRALHEDGTPRAVAERLLRFATVTLRARRAAVVRQHPDSIELVAGHGIAGPPHVARRQVSSALALASLSQGPTTVPRFDRLRDPWLCTVLPGARRTLVVRLDIGLAERTWLLLEQGPRDQRRSVAVLAQAAGTAALALSRVQLLAEATARAAQDPLTGVPNRRALDDLLAQLSARYERSGHGFCVVMVDVDRFKSINDSLGHRAGDHVLQRVATVLQDQLRRHETVARYGGEEFAVVLPDTTAEQAVAVAERLRLALHTIDDPVRVTASFGVAGVPADAVDAGAATELADAALRRAKADGRDRVVASGAAGAAVVPAGGG